MNSGAKYGLIWASGVIVGAVGTYFGMKRYFEDRYDEERQELIGIYLKKDGGKSASLKPGNESPASQIDPAVFDKHYIDPKSYKDYTSMYGGDDISDEKDPDTVIKQNLIAKESIDMASKEHPAESGLRRPRIITEDEFDEHVPAYDRVTLEYYTEDDILVETLNFRQVDISQTVSAENLEYFDNIQDEVMYVRNDELGIDYEVCKNFESYEEEAKGHYGLY